MTKTFDDSTVRWIVALSISAIQNGVAIFAVYSSSQDRLSDGACLGGYFGTLANIAILAIVVIWALVLVIRSFRQPVWHTGLKPLAVVALSSVVAITVGLNAALSCTV
ncbi:MAG: hypothetical protein AAFR73_10635 [Pseudomonadota bacterium]